MSELTLQYSKVWEGTFSVCLVICTLHNLNPQTKDYSSILATSFNIVKASVIPTILGENNLITVVTGYPNSLYISIKNAKNWVHKEGKEGKLTLGIVSKELHGTVELDGWWV